MQLPRDIDTARLHLRRWSVDDAAPLKALIDDSLAQLRPWLPWAVEYPIALEAMADRIRYWTAQFDAAHEWLYAITRVDGGDLLGGIGVHRRGVAGTLEIGYWLGAGKTGYGYVTEAAQALTRAALAQPGITRVVIRCDPRNVRSAAVPRRLGYRYLTTVAKGSVSPPAPHDSMVWEFTPADREP